MNVIAAKSFSCGIQILATERTQHRTRKPWQSRKVGTTQHQTLWVYFMAFANFFRRDANGFLVTDFLPTGVDPYTLFRVGAPQRLGHARGTVGHHDLGVPLGTEPALTKGTIGIAPHFCVDAIHPLGEHATGSCPATLALGFLPLIFSDCPCCCLGLNHFSSQSHLQHLLIVLSIIAKGEAII